MKISSRSKAVPFQKFIANRANSIDATLERNLNKALVSDNLNLQIIKRQNSVLHYFSTISTSDQDKHCYKNLLNVIDTSPTNLISYFSSLIFNRVSLWIQKFITMPKEVASIISQFFVNDDHLSFFAYITFPSIYHHFVTSEFCEYAAQLVLNMIMNEQRYVGNIFALSYLQSSKFFEALWYNFDSSNPKEDAYARFLQAIQAANVCFTKSQIQIFIQLFEKSIVNFGRVIYGRLFWNSYIEFHEGHDDSPISKLLQSMVIMTRSSQFTEIYNAIINQKYTLEKIKLVEYGKINKIPMILSPHEILYLQRIAQSTPSVFEYTSNDLDKLKVHHSCEKNLKQLYFYVDFKGIFNIENNQTNMPSLFMKSTNDNYCEWTNSIIEKNANHKLYLSMIEREKYTRSEIIKTFSKLLLMETDRNESSSSPFTNWINRFYKISFYPSSIPTDEKVDNSPKIESKVFKYSLNPYISDCHNKEVKLWIYLRNYAKCDRSMFHNADYTKIFNDLKHIKNQFNNDFNNTSFESIFKSISSLANSFPFHDKASTVQIASLLGMMIKNASSHFGIPGDSILLKLLSQIHYRTLAKEIIWSKMILQHVPEIKKLLPNEWNDGLNFIFEILNNIVLKYAADANQSNENSPNSHMESYSLDDLVKLDSP